jgi:tryptophan-rich sensory protein
MTARGRRGWKPILTAAAVAIAVATLGGLVTHLGPWYYHLKKPSWQPPDWLFGPAWTVIFALAAAAGVLAWRSVPPIRVWARIVGVFTANGLLNIAWSTLFFGVHRPDWGLAEVAALWLSVVALIVVLAPASRSAALLIVPYLLWVSFAAVLNWEIVRLNYPFA